MKNKIFFSILLAFCFSTGVAQKVGLVLSGGGAKGLAHIGVIKALEENHIPISYITGTSMGAIVGGLYAAGYSPREMEEFFKSEDFKNWSNGIIDPKYKPYYKKFDANPSLYDLDFFRNMDNLKFLLPVKKISTGQMDISFVQLFSPASASCENDFNKLFVPFRCVATDLSSNQQVILSKGDLGSAIRASMSIPVYFKPVNIDGALLYDGGLLNNFPVDVMSTEFHPDLIIGSTVEFTSKNLKDNLFNQLENMITKKTAYHVPDSLGFTIKSPVNKIGLFDFEKLDSIVKIGYESAMKVMDQIKSRVPVGTDVRDLKKEREEYRRNCPPLIFHQAEITGVEPRLRQYVVHSLFQNEKVLPFETLKNHYYTFLAENRLKSVQPSANYDKDSGYYKLQMKAEAQRPFSVAIGGYFSLSDINEGFLGINYRIYSAKPINLRTNIQFGRYYTSFLFGPRIEFANVKPFSMDLLFNKTFLNYFTGSSELFLAEKSCYITRSENKVGLNFNFPHKVNSRWESGFFYSNQEDHYFQNNSFSRMDTPDETNFISGNVYLKFENGEMNKKQYPTDGKYLSLKATLTYGNEFEIPGSTSPSLLHYKKNHTYAAFDFNYEKYFHLLNDHFRIALQLDSYFSNKGFYHNYTSSLISANSFSPTVNSTIRFLPFLRSVNFAAGGLKLIIPVKGITPSTHFRLEGYYFQPIRQMLSTADNAPYYDPHYLNSKCLFGCGGLVIHTLFGPAALLVNVYDQGDPKVFLQASFGYLLNGRN